MNDIVGARKEAELAKERQIAAESLAANITFVINALAELSAGDGAVCHLLGKLLEDWRKYEAEHLKLLVYNSAQTVDALTSGIDLMNIFGEDCANAGKAGLCRTWRIRSMRLAVARDAYIRHLISSLDPKEKGEGASA